MAKKVKVLIVEDNGGDLWAVTYDKNEKTIRYWCDIDDTETEYSLWENCVDNEYQKNAEMAGKFINSEYWEWAWDWFNESDIECYDEPNHLYFRGIKKTKNLEKSLSELFGDDDETQNFFPSPKYPIILAERDFQIDD